MVLCTDQLEHDLTNDGVILEKDNKAVKMAINMDNNFALLAVTHAKVFLLGCTKADDGTLYA